MATLLSVDNPDNLFVQLFSSLEAAKLKDSKNKLFFDRDGILFRFILDYLRNKSLILPDNFTEKKRLKREAEYYKLPKMVKYLEEIENEANNQLASLNNSSSSLQLRHLMQNNSSGLVSNKMKGTPGTIILGYRGTFSFGRESLSDVKFRKISRILVCGRVQLCREVFGETLNESRDPDHGVSERYTSRFFLKHTFLEQAFDTLNENGFNLIGTCATGTNSPAPDAYNKANTDSEESRWLHYNEFVFCRN